MKKHVRKATKKTATRRKSVSLVKCDCGSLTCKDCGVGFWGKDQSLVLLLSAAIVILVVAGLYMTGWL